MKKSTKTVLLIGTMGLAFASCQKETFNDVVVNQ